MTNPVVIGDCELWLGDCLELLPTIGRVDACITDPPYGIPHKFGEQHKINGVRKLQFDWDGPHVNEAVFSAIGQAAGLAQSAFVFCGLEQASHISAALAAAGYTAKAASWVKTCPPPALPGNWWPSGFELAVYGYRPSAWFGDQDAKRSNVFYADSYRHGQPGKVDHPTQKPLGLIERITRSIVPKNGVCLDPFMGSGTTLVACAKLGRRGIGIEIEPRYFDIAVRRVEEAYRQPDFFVTRPAPVKQGTMI